MKNRIKLIAVLLCLCSSSFAQGDFRLSEQMFSRIAQNPSAVGNNANVQIFTLGRVQWVTEGLDETPTSALINAHYFAEKLNSGFGLSVAYDELGISNQTIDAKIVYAYNIDLYDGGLLSLGLSAGVVNKTFDPNRHVWMDPTDPNIPAEVVTNTSFDMDFGFEYSYKYVLVGASLTHLPNIMQEVATTTAPSQINAYIRGNIPLPKDFSLAPAFAYMNVGALSTVPETISEDLAQENIYDINLTAFYQGKYWFGSSYRVNSSVSFMAGFEWEWLRVGYSYDLNIGDLADYAQSSHEIMLSFVIPTSKEEKW